MNILFICKFNRFRSKVAEAVFNKLNKNPKNKAKSAGIIRGSPLDKMQISVAKEKGFNLKSGPKGLTTELLRWQDLAVIVADDVPESILKDNKKYGKKLIVWKIKDARDDDKEKIGKIIDKIEKKVKGLVKELRWK